MKAREEGVWHERLDVVYLFCVLLGIYLAELKLKLNQENIKEGRVNAA